MPPSRPPGRSRLRGMKPAAYGRARVAASRLQSEYCPVPRAQVRNHSSMLYVSLFVLCERMEGRAIAAFPHDAPKSRDQLRSGRAQLIVMMRRQFAEDLLPFGRKRQQHFAAIVLSTSAVDKSPRLEAVHQLHGAVVADLHAI